MEKFVYTLSICFLLSCCSHKSAVIETSVDTGNQTIQQVKSLNFNADSAYSFVRKQVLFGPRVPNTEAHRACANYLAAELERHGAKLYVQETVLTAYNGEKLNAKNIIGAFNPEQKKRVLLCAHWDTRPYSDQDKDEGNWRKPIDGADDGASGVGVLLEIARQLGQNLPNIGVDIIFFDAEDYGTPEFASNYTSDSWCLGSQFWAKTPHIADYKAEYGILLDMVGAKNAVFYKEYTSMRYASRYVEKVWAAARSLGHGKYFINARGGGVVDDHQYVISGRRIPCIDIINYDPNSESGFGHYWHTQDDTMDNIDRNTLTAVGATVLSVIYE